MKALLIIFFLHSGFIVLFTYKIQQSFLFLFTLMGILIVFMGNIIPKIFYQRVFAVFTCVFYAYMHVIWSTVYVTTTQFISCSQM